MNQQPTPIVSPIGALLRSRKAMTTLLSMLISLGVPFAPGLEAHRAELLEVGLILSAVLAAVLVGGTAFEDAAEKGAPTTITTGSAESVNVNTTPPASPTDTSHG